MLIDEVIKMHNSTKTRVVEVLELKKNRNGLTLSQLQKQVGTGAAARVSEARFAGFPIYSNRKTFANGRTSTVYRLGKPSKRFTRNMKAGRTQIAVRSLYTRAA